MICKDKATSDTQSARLKAGDAHEQSVAFFLRREFKNQSDILVFNDLALSFDGEKCQIDHLIVYRYGFILIESKSITGDVRVNSLGEWSRSYNRQWSGMASPIKQVELQQKLLKELLAANASRILGKLIFNKLQIQFGGRSWDQLCAISSNAIIDREEASESVKNQMIKAEFIVDRCKELMNLPVSILDSASTFFDYRVGFKFNEMENTRKFLLEADNDCRSTHKKLSSKNTKVEVLREAVTPAVTLKVKPMLEVKTKVVEKPKENIKSKSSIFKKSVEKEKTEAKNAVAAKTEVKGDLENIVACKKCNKTDSLEGKWGKYSYYVFCSKCECTTSMKINCPSCESKNVKNRKEKSNYYVVCLDCEKEALVMN